ncbi:MAG TPA: AEC family transporter [Phycisphaerae bacterium]|nr:AEC family transporter [Phycisphaerae bacterium]
MELPAIEFVAAVDPVQISAQLGTIFYHIVLPILLVAGLGWILQRSLGLDMPTLTRLNFYFVIPALIYFSLVTSKSSASEIGQTVLFAVAMLAAQAVVAWVAAVIRRVPADQRRTLLMTTMFYNSGNYGLPLQKLAFEPMGTTAGAAPGAAAVSWGDMAANLQIFVIIVQNFSGFTLGVLLAAGGRGVQRLKANLLHIAKFPPIYALGAALLTLWVRRLLGPQATAEVSGRIGPFWQALTYVKEGFYAIALCTLGAQLGLLRRGKNRYPVKLSLFLRLLMGPALGLALIYAFGLHGFIAQVLLISTSMPTAVNCMLLCLEFDNHPDYAARAVFYSTLLSPITVTLTIFLAQSNLLPGFGM